MKPAFQLAALSLYAGSLAWGYCAPLRGTLWSELTSEGIEAGSLCESPVGLCTRGILKGSLGQATTHYTVTQLVPVGTLSDGFSYRGRLIIRTPRGVLTAEDVGLFDTKNGLVTSQSPEVSGSGKWEGSSGALFTSGFANDADQDGSTEFRAKLWGRVCHPPVTKNQP